MYTVAFVPLARITFDIPYATEKTHQLREQLQQAGLHLVGPNALITDLDSARQAAQTLAGQPLDLVIIVQATFADTSMVMTLTETLHAPVFLWAFPEPEVGGRLRLNSLCGINLAAFALKQADRRYRYAYAEPDNEAAIHKVRTAAKAGQVLRILKQARIGVVGEHPAGFEPCAYDDQWLHDRFGVQVKPYDLQAMFARADAVAPDRVDERYAAVARKLSNLGELNTQSVRGTLSFYEAMRDTISADQLNAVAVRCWPETFVQRDCAICASSSMLSDECIPATCEADVNGTVTQLILQTLSGEPAFGTDLVAMDKKQGTVTFWHCGLAPLSMADPSSHPRGALHSNRQRPLLMEFPLKPGRATVARLTRSGGNGGYRLVVGGGNMIHAPMSFTGTSGVFRFDTPVESVLDTIMTEGLDHHYSITYGNHVEALLMFADMARLPVVRL
ncbi:MAG: L-fucose/L-arabinose isomerase family protein [Anaerolineae bacterium]|nr:L-fucose/L-arabinose isomerase family protein [Anaerolineae bacterium]